MAMLDFIRGDIVVSGDALYAVNASMKIIDDYIVIPSAIGCLVTGLFFSWLTNWGFTKFYWVIVKWVLTVVAILFGTFFIGPWLNELVEISRIERILALQNAVYLSHFQSHALSSLVQIASMIFMIVISVLKPWGKRG
ncbi:hypothetical protein [Heliomicrobium undosum]|nr:hypothetical protein [Heliomicrobium undosum]